MDEVAALLDRMRELEPEVYVYGPAPEDTIRQLESAFGRPMPPSYRAFLARFGGLSILNSSYSGIIDGKVEQGRGWAWTDTKYAREWCQLPEHYLVVQPDEGGGFGPPGAGGMFGGLPLRTFIERRAASVAAQSAGKTTGHVPAMTAFGPPGGFGPGNQLARPLLDALDADKDGRVSEAEFAAGMKKHFGAWDRDKNGALDQREIAEGLQKLMPAGPPRP